jgi:hypothetical protein
MGDIIPLRSAFGTLTRAAPPASPGTFDAMVAGRDPARPPITREHELVAALMIIESNIEYIARTLDIEDTSWPAHIPQSVAEAINSALHAIAAVKRP